MCGISGTFSFAEMTVSSQLRDSVREMTNLMTRRGPDDEGFWDDGRHCALGFRRLAVLDLSPQGHQPMLSLDARYALVFNGEVYNFSDLRRELKREGVVFRSDGDTEVVLYSLIHWGKAALDRFNGMFALGFYDSLRRTLILARDHAGIKPIYYLHTPRGVVFGSQYDQILIHPWSHDHEIDLGSLSLYLQFGYIPAPYALLESSGMLEPGSWFEISVSGNANRGRYFEFPVQAEPDLKGDEAIDAVDEAVSAAVRRQLASDVPVGSFLSGGVDSPLVTAKFAETFGRGAQAFTIGLNGNSSDETVDARKYASSIGIEHHVRQFTEADAVAIIDDVVASCAEPFADYSIFPTLLVSRVARERVTVMLSGDGGDELFWGYPGRFGSVLRLADHFRWPYSIRMCARTLRRLRGGRNPRPHLVAPTIGDWYRGKHTRLFERQLKSIFEYLPPLPGDFTLFKYDGYEPDQTAQWLRWNEFVGHLSMVLLKVDRASMHHSLEVRVPLLDRQVIRIAARIHWRSCFDASTWTGKKPLRASLVKHLGHQSTTKRGFTVPMSQWLRGPLRSVLLDVLIGRRDLVGLAIRPRGMEGFIKQHLDGTSDHGWSLWLLLSLALWEDRHLRSRRVRSAG